MHYYYPKFLVASPNSRLKNRLLFFEIKKCSFSIFWDLSQSISCCKLATRVGQGLGFGLGLGIGLRLGVGLSIVIY